MMNLIFMSLRIILSYSRLSKKYDFNKDSAGDSNNDFNEESKEEAGK